MKKRAMILKKISTTLFILMLILPVGIFTIPTNAHAQFVVSDPATEIATGGDVVTNTITTAGVVADKLKQYVLDPLAWAVAKAVLNSLVQSTVKWINSGFSGAPSFTTNLNSTLLSTANSASNSFLNQLSTNGSIKSPFENSVAAGISTAYNTSANGGALAANPYTLNQTTKNDTAFFNGQFIQGGGLNTWAAAWSSSANNPFGAAMLQTNALNSTVSANVSNQTKELDWGKGFQSFKGNCNSPTTTSTSGKTSTNLGGNNTCATASIKTPGSVIEGQLEKSLGSGIDQLVSAHQLDEIVSALVGQLTKTVLGSGGLSGASAAVTPATGGTSGTTSTAQTAANANLSSSFIQTLTQQITQLQTFQTQWNTINSAANTAKTALAASTCFPNAQMTIASTVQPVIDQAATELSNAATSITSINKIQNELPPTTNTGSTAVTIDPTTALSRASADYSTLLSSPTLPSPNDIATAGVQSADNSNSSSTPFDANLTLVAQMNQLTKAAQKCATAPAH